MNTSIARFLFPAPAQRSTAAIFIWWESRRLAYNAIVGATGVFSLGVMALIANLPPGSTELPPVPLVILYGIGANLCYCLGPLAESALELIWPRKLLPTGPALFRMGLTFSLGLTVLPIAVMALDWLVRCAKWLF
jgi:hypothetical protein